MSTRGIGGAGETSRTELHGAKGKVPKEQKKLSEKVENTVLEFFTAGGTQDEAKNTLTGRDIVQKHE